jgi:hypothetical protein
MSYEWYGQTISGMMGCTSMLDGKHKNTILVRKYPAMTISGINAETVWNCKGIIDVQFI